MVRGATAVVTLLHDRVDAEFFDAAGSQLRCVANVAVGYDNVDVAEATRRGVLITNTPGVLTEATADLTLALILMVTRRLGEGERMVRAGERWSWSMFFLLGMGLQDKTLGIVGLGATNRRCTAGACVRDADYYADAQRADAEVEAELEAAFVGLDELLAKADVLCLHCPLTEETRHLIDAERLRRMKPTAFLVNTARGPIVDEAALAEALHERRIAGAALDVYEHEPEVHPWLLEWTTPSSSPTWARPRSKRAPRWRFSPLAMRSPPPVASHR